MKRFGLVLALLAVVVIAGPAFAQEQTGSVVGKITADGGESLPGVSVELKGPAGTLVAVTDARGEYRFPRVSPGAYKVTARLQGFQTYENSRIPVTLGDRATVNVVLKISSVTETVVVTGERVQIAVGENSTSTAIGAEQLALLPKGRDFTSVVTQAAGVRQEASLGGISVDGASGSENRFVIDGVDTTDPFDGSSGQLFITDFLEEVQVKSAGYAAEFGGALGGVINAVTKSGTNEFHGWAGAYYENSSLNGSERPVQYEADPSLYRTYPKDKVTRFEPGFGLGGPILTDGLWFYLGYNPTLRTTDRTPTDQAVATQDRTDHYFTGNLKANIGSKLLVKFSANLSPTKIDGVLPARDGSGDPNQDLALGNDFPSASYSLSADFVPSSSIYLTARGGYYLQDQKSFGNYPTERFFFRSGAIGTPNPLPTTDPRYRPTGWSSVPAAAFNAVTAKDLWERKSAGMDVNVFANFAGSHAFKAGVNYELLSNDVLTGENGNQYDIRWGLADRFGVGVKGTYGSLDVRSIVTLGLVESTNIGIYLQDTWTVHRDLTLNLGVRTEQETIPNYATIPGAPDKAFEFKFQDKLAPRIGFAWDVMGKQTIKAYGSYGTYYDIMKLNIARGSFGGDKWISNLYQMNNLDWQGLPALCSRVSNNASVNPCPTLAGWKTFDARFPADPTDPNVIEQNLLPMQNREFQLGLDYQLTKNSVVSARYVNKTLIDTIEDIGTRRIVNGSVEEIYVIGNPGKGITGEDPPGPVPAVPQAVRDYQAIELTYNRRFSDNWSFRGVYTYSQLEGNYPGLATSDEVTNGVGRSSPNTNRVFDAVHNMYDMNGNAVYGNLPTDRPHAIQVSGSYRAPFNTSIGVNAFWRSGSPLSTQALFGGVEFYPNGRGDLGTTASVSQFDLLIAQPFQIGKMQLELSVNVLNLFDTDTPIGIDNNKYLDDVRDMVPGCDGSEDCFFENVVGHKFDTLMAAGGATDNPYFLKATAYQAPRSIRFGVKLIF